MNGEGGSGLLCSRIHVFLAKDYPQATTGGLLPVVTVRDLTLISH